MTIDEATIHAIKNYRDILKAKVVHSANHSDVEDWTKLTRSQRLRHALWMAEELLTPQTAHYSIDKKSRWLGFIQCVMVMEGVTSIKKERNITRPWFNSPPIKRDDNDDWFWNNVNDI